MNALTVYWVLAHYQKALCYEQLAQPTAARQRYKEFLSFWGGAAREIPQVQHARERMKLLSQQSRASDANATLRLPGRLNFLIEGRVVSY